MERVPEDFIDAMEELTKELPTQSLSRFGNYGFLMSRKIPKTFARTDFKRIYPQLRDFSHAIPYVKGHPLSHGYTLSYEPQFQYHEGYAFGGNHIVIRDPERNVVGGLGFLIGMPIEVTVIQGVGSRPREFYRKTGQHIDQALVDSLIRQVGTHFKAQVGDIKGEPKVVFDIEGLHKMRAPMRNRIIKRYMPKAALALIERTRLPKPTQGRSNIWPNLKPGDLRVRERFFAHARRQQPRRA